MIVAAGNHSVCVPTLLNVETEAVARCGEILALKVGKDWRFHEDALLRWSEGQYSDLAGKQP